jgi:CRISPR/Cas system-associated exonuclease Cas4 (RecB family)
MTTYKHKLSKSRYNAGKQCAKKLYLGKYNRELATPVSASQEALFAQGAQVGAWAIKRFPNGKDATPESFYNYGPSIEKTKEWINNGEEVIYEASFFHDEVMTALDILVQKDEKRIAIEVKSSTEVKDYHLDDGALQYWVMSNSGFTPDVFYLMHINNQYIREGEIEVQQLFHLEDITELVIARQQEVEAKLKELKATLELKQAPEVSIGQHCGSPFDCEFKAHCWKHIPENSVFDITRIGSKAWNYVNKGIYAISDVPNTDHFSERQQIQIEGVKQGSSNINKKEIQGFLAEWQFPLFFFDFETIGPAIPIYDGTSPFKQYAVQYSLHILADEKSELIHTEYLPSFNQDPREELIVRMIEQLGTNGSIVTYNMSFEKGKIKQLAADFPQYEKPLMAINERIVDLLIPFRSSWYYTPKMKGSASIKAVLPALCSHDPELNYKALGISNGDDASNYLKALAEGTIAEDNLETIRKDLLAYCKLDTLAMVKIWEVLKGLSVS